MGWFEAHLAEIDPWLEENLGKFKKGQKLVQPQMWLWLHCLARRCKVPENFQDEEVFKYWLEKRRQQYPSRLDQLKGPSEIAEDKATVD